MWYWVTNYVATCQKVLWREINDSLVFAPPKLRYYTRIYIIEYVWMCLVYELEPTYVSVGLDGHVITICEQNTWNMIQYMLWFSTPPIMFIERRANWPKGYADNLSPNVSSKGITLTEFVHRSKTVIGEDEAQCMWRGVLSHVLYNMERVVMCGLKHRLVCIGMM